jgi:eukaryotic-like serine/threonine-protein kinase
MKISASTWLRAGERFDLLAGLAAEEREEHLRTLAGQDPELHVLVLDLLRGEDDPHPLLAQSAGQIIGSWEGDAALCGQTIGAYRLVQHLGSGAMGSVFRAERADGQFDQTVALKLIRPGAYSGHTLALFREERQILAGLQHPNIARLFDGGIHTDGRPYFTMEYVEGVPITEHCRRRALSLEQRLQLFLQICDALQYAHSRLVAHLDLKPGNILVGPDGRVRLLDFGIARAGMPPDDAAAPAMQHFTLAYASPEQLRREVPGTQSDIFALGLLLHELLSGRHPLQELLDDREALREALLSTGELPAFGRLFDPLPSGIPLRRLRGDLDAICRQALQKNPEKRYPSTEALARDVRAFIGHFPVRARNGREFYRMRKFIRRNRSPFIAGMLAALMIVGTAAYFTRRLAEQRNQARHEAAKALEVSRLLRSVFSGADPVVAGGEQITAVELLDAGVASLHSSLRQQPGLQASMYGELSAIYLSLGQYGRADSLARRAFALYDSLYGPPHADIASSLIAIGQVELVASKHDSAFRHIQSGLDMYRQLEMTNGADYARALTELGNTYYDRNDFQQADSVYRQVLALYRNALDTTGTDLANLLHLIGTTRRKLGDYEEAASYLQKSLALKRNLYADPHAEIAYTLNHLASLRQDQGRPAEGLPFAREAFEQRRKIFGEQHIETLASQSNIARIHVRLNELDQAALIYEEVLSKMRAFFRNDHHYVSAVTNSLAGVYLKQGDYAKAEALCREAHAYNERLLAADDPKRAYALLGLGRALLAQGRAAEARPSLEAALRLREESLPPGHVLTGECRQALGECLLDLADYPAAVVSLEQAYAALAEVPDRYDGELRDIVHNLIRAHNLNANTERAAYYEALLAGL